MSAEALALVLNHSGRSGTDQLVLVGIANHDGDGGAWPSVGTLARYAGVDVRSVQRSIVRLAQAGLVKVERQAGGGRDLADHRRPNRYTLNLRCPVDCDGTARHRTRRHPGAIGQTMLTLEPVEIPDPVRVTPVSPGDASVTGTGDASVTGTGDASVTRTVLRNHPVETPPVGTDSDQTLGPVETVDNPTPAEPDPEPATPEVAASALASIRATLAAERDTEAAS